MNGVFKEEEFMDLACENPVMPSWLGQAALHQSHRVKLFTKLPEHYRNQGWEPEVMSVLGSKALDEFKIGYVWPDGGDSWKAYRAERSRLARENPATPEVKARIHLAYKSWARCKHCKSSKHRAHNCPLQQG